MSEALSARWREWIDWDAPGKEPTKLQKNTPEDVKKEFEEWQRKKEEERSKGIWK